ncbi:MAG: serine/threonine-protein kinase [Leptolyngbyaceae cyanobacterium MO_188.B28]|nr:serine/threonine-protein kinase [Leptolyngbyaceae cyanobacterium MO_188.B28]
MNFPTRSQRADSHKPLGGRYKVIRRLGEGGFGQTFLAEDLHLPGRPICVVKRLKTQFSGPQSLQTARRLFDTEAKVLYKLGEHDQIPRLLAHFEDNQEFYLAQEYIEGEPLAAALESGQPWPEAQVIDLLRDLLQVLSFVHRQNVIHRDIKPDNVICRRDGKIVLIDFGAVKQVSTQFFNSKPGRTNLTIAIGTHGYMPNEQMGGKPLFGSDVYAVGMIGIQGLTSVYPTRLKQDPRTSEIEWRGQAPQASPELADILDHMVRYDFRDRYPSAAEALRALRSLTTAAPPPSLPFNLTFSAGGFVGRSPVQSGFSRQSGVARPRIADLGTIRRIQNRIRLVLGGLADLGAMRKLPNRIRLVLGGLAVLVGLVLLVRPYSSPQLVSQPAAVDSPSDPSPAAADLLSQADSLREAEQPEAALNLYDQAIVSAPDSAVAHWGRCYSLNQLQRPDEAIAACDQALTLDPNNPSALSSKGYALNQEHRYPEALDLFNRAIDLDPDNAEAWSNRGASLLLLDRPAEAIESFDRAINLQSDQAEAWSNRGAALWSLRRFDEAIASIDRAIELQPNYPEALRLRQQIREKLGR